MTATTIVCSFIVWSVRGKRNTDFCTSLIRVFRFYCTFCKSFISFLKHMQIIHMVLKLSRVNSVSDGTGPSFTRVSWLCEFLNKNRMNSAWLGRVIQFLIRVRRFLTDSEPILTSGGRFSHDYVFSLYQFELIGKKPSRFGKKVRRTCGEERPNKYILNRLGVQVQ